MSPNDAKGRMSPSKAVESMSPNNTPQPTGPIRHIGPITPTPPRKLPAYPKYKDSGVEWLGKVPEHWEVKPCRIIVRERTAKNDDGSCEDYLSLMANVGVIPYEEKGNVGNKKPTDLSKCKMVRRGDYVINSMNYGIGSYGISPYDGVCSSVYIVLTPESDIVESRYAFRTFENREFQLLAQSFGNGILEHRCAINWDILKGIGVAVPPLPEQRAIAAFLDRETTRIDTLVAKKRELTERLKEKRTALISRTVTRGLPPDAARAAGLPANPRLKPSGIEWLGDVPEGWEVKPVKFITRIGNGSTPSRENPAYWEDGDYPWLNSSVVNQEAVVAAEEFVTGLALRECHLPRIQPPAVLVGITGQGRTRGMASTLLFEATINQHIAYLKPLPSQIEVGFLRRVFDMAYSFLRSESDGGGSTKGAITCEQIGGMRIPVPSLPEQTAIAAYLDAEIAKIDAMVGKVEEAIERLLEYRTALITAAVTGKIDVRKAI